MSTKTLIIIIYLLPAYLLPTLIFEQEVFAQEKNKEQIDTNENETTKSNTEAKFVIENGLVFFIVKNEKKEIALPGKAISIKQLNNKFYIALGEDGLAILQLNKLGNPKIIRHVSVSHGSVTSILSANENLWMQVDSTTAVKITTNKTMSNTSSKSSKNDDEQNIIVLTTPLPSKNSVSNNNKQTDTSSDAKNDEEQPQPILQKIKILKKYPGKAKLNIGSNQGVKPGDQFQAVRLKTVTKTDNDNFEGHTMVARLVVEAVNSSSCIVKIWRGDKISTKDTIQTVQKYTKESSIYHPRHLENLVEVNIAIRPIINIGTSGFGMLNDLSVAWWGKHYFVDFRMQPLGFGWTDSSKVVSSSMLFEGGYNGRSFAVGMGIGAATLNSNLNTMMKSSQNSDDDGTQNTKPVISQQTNRAFALSQTVRLGAKDGLNLTVSNILIQHNKEETDYENSQSGFIYGGTNGKFTIPLALRTDMFLEGGGGLMGYAFGAIGVFTWIKGNGDAKSIGISASAGFAGVWGERKVKEEYYDEYTDRISVAGPMFSLGATFRFGSTEKVKN